MSHWGTCCRPRFVNAIKYHRDTGEIIWQNNPFCGLDTTDASGDRLTTYNMLRIVHEPVESLSWIVCDAFELAASESPKPYRLLAINADGDHVATVIAYEPGTEALYSSGPLSQATLMQGGGYPVFRSRYGTPAPFHRANADGTIADTMTFASSVVPSRFVVHSSGDIVSSRPTPSDAAKEWEYRARNTWAGANTWTRYRLPYPHTDKGSMDCSANPPYPSGVPGDKWILTGTGKIGGAAGRDVFYTGPPIMILCEVANAGGSQADVGASWLYVWPGVVPVLIESGLTCVAIDDADAVLLTNGYSDSSYDRFLAMPTDTGSMGTGGYSISAPHRMMEAVGLASGFLVYSTDGSIITLDADANYVDAFSDAQKSSGDTAGHVAADDEVIAVVSMDDRESDGRRRVRLYDHAGVELWSQRWVINGTAMSVAIDGDGHVVVVGSRGLRVADPL